jgi:VWFA-related protein
MIRTVIVPFLLAALLAPLPAAAQPPAPEQPAEEQETFFESIDVEVTNIEVFVTDRKGQRVSGLTRDDFEILEDGKPVEITNFFAVDEGRGAAPGSEPAPAEPGAEAPASPEGLPAEQRLHLAIVVDDLTLGPQNRNRLLQSIEKDVLPRLRPDDLALVAVIDGSSVRVAQGLTADPALLRSALEEATRSAPLGSARLMDKREILSRIDSIGLIQPTSGVEEQTSELNARVVEELYYDLQSYAKQRTLETQASLGALTGFVDSLSGLPGRKAVLYVGGGLSVRPGEALAQAWQSKFATMARTMSLDISQSSFDGRREDLSEKLQDLIEHANANRVTFYTLGALDELAGLAADTRTSDNWGTTLENLEKANLRISLERIADGTGGLAGVDLSDPRGLFDRMREDFDSYYSLGYVPARRRDGKNRKIEVRVRGREDLQVRNREGRRDQTNRERMSDRTLAALVLDPGKNPLELEVEFVEEKREKDQYLVEVLVKFPLAKLVLLPKDRFHEGQVSLFVSARDSRGRMSPIQEIAVPIRVPNDQLLTALGQTAAYKATLLLRDDAHTVAVSIRDELGNADSAIAVPFTPGKKG